MGYYVIYDSFDKAKQCRWRPTVPWDQSSGIVSLHRQRCSHLASRSTHVAVLLSGEGRSRRCRLECGSVSPGELVVLVLSICELFPSFLFLILQAKCRLERTVCDRNGATKERVATRPNISKGCTKGRKGEKGLCRCRRRVERRSGFALLVTLSLTGSRSRTCSTDHSRPGWSTGGHHRSDVSSERSTLYYVIRPPPASLITVRPRSHVTVHGRVGN